MSKNYTRVPVRFIESNKELLKSQTPGLGWTGPRPPSDWQPGQVSAVQGPTGVQPTYRTPVGRVNGNELFRRYPSGQLDVQHAVNTVLNALHRAKDSAGVNQLNSMEQTALSCLFPGSFDYIAPDMAPSVATVQLRLSPAEVSLIRTKVAQHLAEEMNYNAGLGGGSVPGRSSTRS